MEREKSNSDEQNPDSSQRKGAPIPRQDPGEGHSQDADRHRKLRHPRTGK
jgi:hypothetical protein